MEAKDNPYSNIPALDGLDTCHAAFNKGRQAGIKEVVERSNEPCPHTGGFLKRDCDTCWQAQVKDWGL